MKPQLTTAKMTHKALHTITNQIARQKKNAPEK